MKEPMHGPIFASLALVLSATATAAIAQGLGQETLSADPRTRCAQLVAFWQQHGGSKSEGGGGGDVARKNAEVDCGPLRKRHPGDGRVAAAQRLYCAAGGRQLTGVVTPSRRATANPHDARWPAPVWVRQPCRGSCAIAVIGGAAGLFNACFGSSVSPAAPPPLDSRGRAPVPMSG
jgi:hypothetical protein